MSSQPKPRIFHIATIPDLTDRIRAAFDGIKTYSEIAREIGTTARLVSKVIAEIYPDSMRARKGESLARVKSAHDGTKTTQQIADELGLRRSYVRTAMLKLELPIVRHKNLDRRNEYQACADAGMTHDETAEKLGVKPAAARKMSANFGITFKSRRYVQPKACKPVKPVSAPGFSASPEALRRYFERAK